MSNGDQELMNQVQDWWIRHDLFEIETISADDILNAIGMDFAAALVMNEQINKTCKIQDVPDVRDLAQRAGYRLVIDNDQVMRFALYGESGLLAMNFTDESLCRWWLNLHF